MRCTADDAAGKPDVGTEVPGVTVREYTAAHAVQVSAHQHGNVHTEAHCGDADTAAAGYARVLAHIVDGRFKIVEVADLAALLEGGDRQPRVDVGERQGGETT